MRRRNTLLLLLSTMALISCKTQKVCTSDSTIESTHTETVITDSVKTAHMEQTITTDSVVIEKTIEKETVITIDLDGKEIYRETNCNTTTNRDHFRDTRKKVEDKEEVKHEDSQKNDSTLIQNHSEEKVIIQEPSLWDRIRQSLADCIMWGFGLLVLILISYHYYKKWQGKKKQ